MEQAMNPAENSNDAELSNAGSPRGGTAEEVAAYVGRKAEDAASFVGRKAENATLYVGHKAEDAASYVGQKTGEASAAVGSGLRSLGDTVRSSGPEGGVAASASAAVADTLESSGRYLQEEGLNDMVEDITRLIRRYPIPALVIGAVAGYLTGKAMSPRS